MQPTVDLAAPVLLEVNSFQDLIAPCLGSTAQHRGVRHERCNEPPCKQDIEMSNGRLWHSASLTQRCAEVQQGCRAPFPYHFSANKPILPSVVETRDRNAHRQPHCLSPLSNSTDLTTSFLRSSRSEEPTINPPFSIGRHDGRRSVS